MLHENLHDHPLGIQVVVPDAALGQTKRAVYDRPKASPAPDGQAAGQAAGSDDEQPCVLLIEDSSTYRAIMSAKLAQVGYRVLTAPDGMAGLDLARANQPEAKIRGHQFTRLTVVPE
jgi:hypothetical protein